jgi:hypothetical protein
MSARAPEPAPEALQRLKDSDWTVLLDRIRTQRCTPILGTGIRSDGQTLRSQIAQEWAKEYEFPLPQGSDNLARVGRFVSVKFDGPFTKGQLVARLGKEVTPDFEDPHNPYRILAKMPLPVFITTDYDDVMYQALKRVDKDAWREVCRWNVKAQQSVAVEDARPFHPTVANPVIYHFHGWMEDTDSLVVTEDDYFEFLISVSRDKDLIPPRIEQAMVGSSLLLLGYRLDDWDFRVMFHLLATYLERSTSRTHVAVQIAQVKDEEPEDVRKKAQDYLSLYFEKYKNLYIRIYWGSCQDFLEELGSRWAQSYGAN